MSNFFQKNFNNSNLKYVFLVVIAIFFFGFGYLFGDLSNKNVFSKASASDSPILVPSVLNEVRHYLNNYFIPWKASSTLPTNEDLAYGMLKGYVNSYGDPYTQFFDPVESKQFEEDVKGSFGGVGAVIGFKDGIPAVISVLKDNPAEKAGVKDGDLIVSVDGTFVQGMSVDEIVRMVRGEIGTDVKMGVIHKDETKTSEVIITRAEINTPILDTETIDDVFIIHFYSFTETSSTKFNQAILEFANSRKNKLIIDLRGNGGGYLDSAIDIASFFLPSDKLIVVEKSGKSLPEKGTYSKGYNYFSNKKIKVAVLINEGSASASEIVAGALKDHGVATIVGEKSFGKGSVQQLIKLSDGSDLKLTVAKWYTPKGVNISESGITPDIVASSSAKIELDKKGNPVDTQLKKAVEIIKNLK
ncbi:hypothetical protein SDC9_07882 [bioreactor metagenome]|uniref:PDZ domain-containing protein n=1 Tax=bioreactor metagenome TaxID=1076179 RepID=A0A644T8P0_9ZZZZ|nr:S41 family peptidase [Candidatus Elulimicrobiales bacterium]